MTTIPAADLALASPGATDTVVGVDEATGSPRRFAMSNLGGVAIGYATLADLQAETSLADQSLRMVTNDPTPANNGLWRWDDSGAAWVQAADRLSATETDVSLLESLFDAAATTNLFDPSTGVDGGGVQANGATFAIARWGRLVLPVSAGQEYVVSLTNAESAWILTQNAFVNFYNHASTFNGTTLIDSSVATENGVTYTGTRTVSFTAPTGAVVAVISVYNSTNAAPSSDDFDAMWDAVMANVGTTLLDYAPYRAAGSWDFPATVQNPSGGVVAQLDGTVLYIRQPDWKDSDKCFVRKLTINETPSTSEPGTVDFVGQKYADSHYPDDYTHVAYSAGDAIRQSIDNSPPIKLNNMYLGGRHGVAASYYLTIAGHGLANADVGDVGDVSGVDWVLAGIIDADTLLVVAANTGASETRWAINGTLAATGTITFTSAGAKSWTARTSKQVYPLAQTLVHEILLDDATAITEDGEYAGNSITVRERYGIPNPANWLATLIAEKGTATPKAVNDAAIDTQVFVDQSWRFDRFGAMTGYCSVRAGQEFRLITTSSFDYIGGWQHQTIFKTGHTTHQYVPDLAGTVGGYDLKATADVSANASTVTVTVADASDAADPPSHFAQFVKLAGSPVYGLGFGYIRTKGAGVPATRAQNNYLWQLSTSEKQYAIAWDGTRYSQVVPEGTVMATAFWEAAYAMGDYPTHTVDVVYEDAGKVYRVIDIHDTVSFHTVPMPDELVGKAVTVISKSASLTLHTDDFVPGGGLLVSTTGGWGRLIVEIG